MFAKLPIRQLGRLYRKPLTEADVAPQLVKNEKTGKSHWRKPRLSLRVQSDLRKVAEMVGDEPVSLGLPERTVKKPLRIRPNKLEKHERKRAEREASIRQNMDKMNDTIKNWREVNNTQHLCTCSRLRACYLHSFRLSGKSSRIVQGQVQCAILKRIDCCH
jgi:hypothetical protein